MTARRQALAFEAAVHRLALLAGVSRETDVLDWALRRFAEDDAPPELGDVVMAPPALSPLREALEPLAAGVDGQAVSLAVLAMIAAFTEGAPGVSAAADGHEPDASARDGLRMLRVLRTEAELPSDIVVGIKAREDWKMLEDAGLPATDRVTRATLHAWLTAVLRDASTASHRNPEVT